MSDKSFDGQTAHFLAVVAEAMPRTLSADVMQNWANNPDALQKALRMALCPPAKEAAPEPVIDSIIRVDRSVSPTYPNWVKKVMHPDLQSTGSAEYDIALVEKWLHPDQENSVASGNTIYKHLKEANALEVQLGLADLLAIQAKGIAFFRKHFVGKAVFGWKSVVQDHVGGLGVPCLVERGGRVLVHWGWLGSYWGSGGPGLRFASI